MPGMDEQQRTAKKPWADAFLKTLAITGNVFRACKACEVGRTAVYEERKANGEFAKEWDRSLEDAADRLESEARRRAYKGLTRKKFTGKGEPIIDPATGEQYYEREYSDTLLIFLLKGLNPEKFRERISAEHSGPGGKPIPIAATIRIPIDQFRQLPLDERIRIMQSTMGNANAN